MRELPQRQLVYELRVAIDRVMRSPGDKRFEKALLRMIEANPKGTWSSHVQYNLGATRREWLRCFIALAEGVFV